jgi:hypothetical protein
MRLLLGSSVQFRNLIPVDNIPESIHVACAGILVIEVVGMFPNIQAEDGRLTIHKRSVLAGRQRWQARNYLYAQPEPNCPVAAALNWSLNWSKLPKVLLMASLRSPLGVPPPFGPITSQNKLWLA